MVTAVVCSCSLFPVTLAPDDPPTAVPATPAPLVAVYGDSWTTGWAGDGEGPRGWPQLVGTRLGVSVANQAVGGSGYVRFHNGSTFPHAVATRPVPDADLVVVLGGLNDRDTGDDRAVGAAATVTLTAARLTHPTAPLLVIGPQWFDAHPPAVLLEHRDAVRAAAAAAGARFVDPLAEGWFAGRPDLVRPGDIHPNDAGHRHLADRIAPHVAAALGR